MPFTKVLIANRGEIACRIIRTLDRLGIASVAIYSDAEPYAAHVLAAGEAVRVGPAPATESYLNIDAILDACRETGADAVHPGYGFLSENADFPERLERECVRFIGPEPQHLRLFGLKHAAREAATAAGVPLLPGTGLITSLDEATREAFAIGYPVMLKSTAGGGGIGLQLCETPEELPALYDRVRRLSGANFGDDGLFIEKFVANARHVEVQIFGDGKGTVLALGERDCSLQRRNQKVIEETPAPNLSNAVRQALLETAQALGASVGYSSAGTVEFIYDPSTEEFYFLEVNTRLQVEHPVTEAVTGIDLVEWMIRQAEGDLDLSSVSIDRKGAAIEARIYAEDPTRDFRPSAGRLTHVTFPDDARIDGWVTTGTDVPPHYDPLLAKVIVSGDTREEAVSHLQTALGQIRLEGIDTNLRYLEQISASQVFVAGDVSTSMLGSFRYDASAIEVLAPGAQSTIQDWPGRVGYWHVGVPPSGPMDMFSHRLANRIVGNEKAAAVLELTLNGPTLRFHSKVAIALTGADMQAVLDDVPCPRFERVSVQAGSTLAFGHVKGPGNRAYLAIKGGIDATPYLGSRSTFTLGGFGGDTGRALKTGDMIPIGKSETREPLPVTKIQQPELTDTWKLHVLYGPHGAPDFFTDEDIETLISTAYEVHFNSARTGVRLIGPKPKWARPDGGEAGLHPSNIHDNAYAVGAVDFTGDMPIILGPDGPSLGGFVCPFVVSKADLWKLGQLKPGDTVSFQPITLAEAEAMERRQERALDGHDAHQSPQIINRIGDLESPIPLRRDDCEVPVTYRRTGEDNLLIEFGENRLDLEYRVRAHSLMERVAGEKISALIDVTPGIRSLQLHYDNTQISEATLLDRVDAMERELPPIGDMVIPNRIVHLPLAWDDSQTRLATEKYQATVRPDAPWCPWNIEFIRRVNGLETVDDVKRIVYGADYLVYGLGDVYLGAPVATPIDPRHRLVTTKYNPARTWTPENAVGIGGAYLCIYGMEGPGGYQFVGRTTQIWNTWRTTKAFAPGHPWLLRFFDQIRFFEVDEDDLLDMREAFPHGRYDVRIEESVLSMADYRAELTRNADAISRFQSQRQTAFNAERAHWEENGLLTFDETVEVPPEAERTALTVGEISVDAPVPGSVWQVFVKPGQIVDAGDTVAVLESMKMEIPVRASHRGRVKVVSMQQGAPVQGGDRLAVLTTD
ncbi:MAG: urea carboxylase [Pseudomonadota bacterium]